MQEIWEDIAGYEGYYMVSDHGRVFSIKANKIKEPVITHKGYYELALYRDTDRKRYKIHRLVASAFIPNPEGKPQVNHIDTNKLNNHVSNLEWCTHKENTAHAVQNGCYKKTKAA